MAGAANATLQVTFSKSEDLGNNKIVLEQMTKGFDPAGHLWVRCFPTEDVNVVASVGLLKKGNILVQQVYSEGLKFSDSSEVELRFPKAFDLEILANPLAFTFTEDVFGEKVLSAVDVTYQFDAENNSIVALDNKNNLMNVYGSCSVNYKSLYTVFYYTPGLSDIHGGGVTLTVGSIFAWNQKTVEVLDLELDKDSEDWVEFCRVTSKIVLDEKGVWEFPDNWGSTYSSNKGKNPDQKSEYPDPGTFTNSSDKIDPINCFVDTRVHVIYHINSMGTLKKNDFNNGWSGYWAWFNPYFGSDTYQPVYELTWASPPGGYKAGSAEDFKYDIYHTTWRDIFLTVDKNTMLTELQKEYPGVTAGNKGRT